MKKLIAFLIIAASIAATPHTAKAYGDGDDGENYDPLKGFYNYLRSSIQEIEKQQGSATVKLQNRCSNIESRMLELTGILQTDIDALETFAAEWQPYHPTDFVLDSGLDERIDASIEGNTSITKSSDFRSYKSEVSSTYAKASELQAIQEQTSEILKAATEAVEGLKTKADKATTDSHESRISALEGRDAPGGGGCDSKCGASIATLGAWLGFDTTAAETGKCVEVSNGTGFDTKDKWLGSYAFPWIGETPPDGSNFVPMWDDGGLPMFSASGDWLSDGLALSEDDTDGIGGARLEVKVVETAPGTLAASLDGTATDNEQLANVVTLDESGHLRAAGIGTISVAADGETIERTADNADEAPTLKVKTSGIVDGQTIQTSGRVAHVAPDALCDGVTIKVNENNKLCISAGTMTTNFIAAGAGIKITEAGGGCVVISVDDFERQEQDYNTYSLPVVTGVEYNEDTHQLTLTKRNVMVLGKYCGEEETEVIFTAVSHKSEHESGNATE